MTRLQTFKKHLLSTVTLMFPGILGFYRGPGQSVRDAVMHANSKRIQKELNDVG